MSVPLYVVCQYSLMILLISSIFISWNRIRALSKADEYFARSLFDASMAMSLITICLCRCATPLYLGFLSSSSCFLMLASSVEIEPNFSYLFLSHFEISFTCFCFSLSTSCFGGRLLSACVRSSRVSVAVAIRSRRVMSSSMSLHLARSSLCWSSPLSVSLRFSSFVSLSRFTSLNLPSISLLSRIFRSSVSSLPSCLYVCTSFSIGSSLSQSCLVSSRSLSSAFSSLSCATRMLAASSRSASLRALSGTRQSLSSCSSFSF
mmetsp:Transcript_1481/g.3551  ORF Transcript_1481/g.3551 Transcript_1481/m.3551 type:complete len:262 (-) Transcript_1481:2995-3780(-)